MSQDTATTLPMPPTSTKPAAPPQLTPYDRIEHLENVILQSQERVGFCCGGIVPANIVPMDKLAVMYAKEDGYAGIPFPASAQDVDRALAGADTSPFGRGNETVYDAKYRQAKEYKPPKVALTVDIVSTAAILPAISSKLDITRPLRAVMSKVNMYPEGGFFKAHRDTALGTDYVGTITVCLPTAFTGGELVIQQDGHVVTYDWGTPAGADADVDQRVKWAFLFADVQHEVKPVTSGTRLTVAYDVFYADAHSALFEYRQDTLQSPVYSELKALLQDRELFLPDGGRIAFGFRHAYPASSLNGLVRSLKGIDKQLVDALISCGLKYEYQVVFDLDLDDYGDYIDDEYEEGDFKAPAYLNSYDRDPACWLAEELDDEDLMPMDVIWVTNCGAYGRTDNYMSYGNEAQNNTLYTGACVFVTIPAGADRV